MKNKCLLLILILLVLLFTYAAFSKWMDMKGFGYDMHNQPFPRWLSDALIWLLPVVEMGIVLLLLFEATRLPGLYLSFGLLVLFTLYTAWILTGVFQRIPCSCGGIIKQLSWIQHLVGTLFFAALSFAGIHLQKEQNR